MKALVAERRHTRTSHPLKTFILRFSSTSPPGICTLIVSKTSTKLPLSDKCFHGIGEVDSPQVAYENFANGITIGPTAIGLWSDCDRVTGTKGIHEIVNARKSSYHIVATDKGYLVFIGTCWSIYGAS